MEPRLSARTPLIALLYAARGLRGFGDGFAIIILPAYMTALGYDAVAVGLAATASRLVTALLRLVVGWIAPRHDMRELLMFGAGLMAPTPPRPVQERSLRWDCLPHDPRHTRHRQRQQFLG